MVDPGGQVGSVTQRLSCGCNVYPWGHSSATRVTFGTINCESDENDMAWALPATNDAANTAQARGK